MALLRGAVLSSTLRGRTKMSGATPFLAALPCRSRRTLGLSGISH